MLDHILHDTQLTTQQNTTQHTTLTWSSMHPCGRALNNNNMAALTVPRGLLQSLYVMGGRVELKDPGSTNALSVLS